MKRIYRPELGWENDMRVNVPTCTVVEGESVTQFTGLYDANGNKLVVTVKSEPAGFVVFRERKAVPEPPKPTGIEKGGVPKF